MKCAKCKGEMVKGIVVPFPIYAPIKRAVFRLSWGSKLFGNWGLGSKLEDQQDFETYKCKSCGYLESYAK